MLVAVDFDGAVVGAVVREMEETFGLGAEALSDAGFLSQLVWSRGELAVGDNVGPHRRHRHLKAVVRRSTPPPPLSPARTSAPAQPSGEVKPCKRNIL